MKMKQPLLLIDADDTLWESALFFERAEDDFAGIMKCLGQPDELVRNTVHQRDIQRLEQTGYGARPYMDTLAEIMSELVPSPPSWALASLDSIRGNLLHHPVILLPGVRETMETLSSMPFRTLVYTMGEEDHQADKYRRAMLDDLVEGIEIVERKNVNSLRELISKHDSSPEETMMVGNSPRSDINPATALGVKAVYLQRERTWAAEHQDLRDPGMVTVIHSFPQLLDHLDIFNN